MEDHYYIVIEKEVCGTYDEINKMCLALSDFMVNCKVTFMTKEDYFKRELE